MILNTVVGGVKIACRNQLSGFIHTVNVLNLVVYVLFLGPSLLWLSCLSGLSFGGCSRGASPLSFYRLRFWWVSLLRLVGCAAALRQQCGIIDGGRPGSQT